jgi:hypothetical protein
MKGILQENQNPVQAIWNGIIDKKTYNSIYGLASETG